MSPALGDSPSRGWWHMGWRGRIFSHLFGLVLGAPWLLTGAVGHRNQKGEGWHRPWGHGIAPILVKGERSVFHLAPAAFPCLYWVELA